MTWWGDVDARAVGMATHLLDESAWARLRGSSDLGELVRELRTLGFDPESARPRDVEQAVEEIARRHETVLARWLGPRSRYVRFLVEDMDRRAIRALARGASTNSDREERATALSAWHGLDRRHSEAALAAPDPLSCLETLAGFEQPLAILATEELATILGDWPDLPPLLAVEVALLRAWADRAVTGTRWGGAELRRLARCWIDQQNSWTALSARAGDSPSPDALFLAGGELTRDAFARALEVGPEEARPLLSREVCSELGAALADLDVPTRDLERHVLARVRRHLAGVARDRPLGPAPVVAFLLALRLQVIDLRALLWSLALGAPPPVPEAVS